MRNAIILAMLIGLFGAVSAVQASTDNPTPAVEKSQRLQKDHDRYERKSDVRSEYSEREHDARERSDKDSRRHDDGEDRN